MTGWDYSVADLLQIGDRIATVRHAFNLRDGLSPVEFKVPGRLIGRPSLDEGPTQGVEIDLEAQAKDYLRAMDWDVDTAVPSEKRLRELGLEDVVEVLWP